MFTTDLWYTEAAVDIDISALGEEPTLWFDGAASRPDADSYLLPRQKRCVRCGVVRSVHPDRPFNPICADCKSVLTKAQRKAWKK